MISEDDKVDLRTFDVRKDKPFILHDRQDAFSFFQAQLQGHVLDFIYHLLRFQHGGKSEAVKQTLKRSESIDPAYLGKVVSRSRAASTATVAEQLEQIALEPTAKPGPAVSTTNIDDLLDQFESESGEEPTTVSPEDQLGAQLAAEINMVRKVSTEMLSKGTKSLQNAHHGDDIDKFMNTNEVEQKIADIEAKYK